VIARLRLAALLAAPLALAAASGCSAQAPLTGDEQIQAFVREIGMKNRGAALARIGALESLSGQPNAVATPSEFVDKLMTCKYVATDPRKRLSMSKLTWNCPDGEYLLYLDPEWRAPKLTVGQFVATKTWESWRNMAPPPAPAPANRP
jgi:hypothetical protein